MGSKIYTRKGDLGLTSLFSGEKVAKDDLRLEAYGALDELQAQLGMARSLTRNEEIGADPHRNAARHLRGVLRSWRRIRRCAPVYRGTSSQQRHGAAGVLYRQLSPRVSHLPKHFIHSRPNSRQRGAASGAHRFAGAANVMIVAVNREVGGYDEILVYFNRLSDLLFVLAWSMEVHGRGGRRRAGGHQLAH